MFPQKKFPLFKKNHAKKEKKKKKSSFDPKGTCEIDVMEVDFFVDLGCVGLAVRVELQLPGCSDPGAP